MIVSSGASQAEAVLPAYPLLAQSGWTMDEVLVLSAGALQYEVLPPPLRLMHSALLPLTLDATRLQIRTGEWYAADGKAKHKASQYFEVIGHTCGGWLGAIALILTVFNLMGNGCAQARPFPSPVYWSMAVVLPRQSRCLLPLRCHPYCVCRLDWIDLLPLLT